MDEKEILQKKELVDKYLNKKKYLTLFDMYLYNIDGLSFYIRLDYDKKANTYRVNWINLSFMDDNKVESWLNSNLIYPSMVHNFKNIIASNGIVDDYIDNDDINSKVILNSYLTDYECNKRTFEFKRYIPKCWLFLADAIHILFESLPKYQYPLFQILVEKIIDPDINYVFAFDLKKDNIDELFEPQIIERGKEYFKDDRIIFCEEYHNNYYSVVRGNQDYLVTIINNKDTKEVQMTCSCPYHSFCKHMYATLLAMRKKQEKRFYKIAYIDNDKNIIDNLKNFNYLLCVDIVDDYFIVIDDLDFSFLPILNNNKLSFKIVEDDKNKTLENKLNKYLKKHNK